MAIRSRENFIGAWAFLIGVVIALLIGILTSLPNVEIINEFNAEIYAILIITGFVVGLMNIGTKDSQAFMIAGAVIVIVSRFGIDSVRGSLIGIEVARIATSIFGALSALFVPVTIIIALKYLFEISKLWGEYEKRE